MRELELCKFLKDVKLKVILFDNLNFVVAVIEITWLFLRQIPEDSQRLNMMFDWKWESLNSCWVKTDGNWLNISKKIFGDATTANVGNHEFVMCQPVWMYALLKQYPVA